MPPRDGPRGSGPPRKGPPRAGGNRSGPPRSGQGRSGQGRSGPARSAGPRKGPPRSGPPRGAPRVGPDRARTDRPDRKPQGWPPGIAELYKDRGLIAIEKPPGLPVSAPTSKSTRSVLKIAERVVGRHARPIVVNELDKDASGVLVLASSIRTAEMVGKAFGRKGGSRVWYALVEGDAPSESGTLLSHLHRSARGVTEPVPEGTPTDASQRAVLHYRSLGSGNGLTLLQVRAETDAPGQVRAQLAEAGMPIVGDRAYNATRDDLGRVGLHLAELACHDPRVKDPVPVERKFRSRTPAEFWTAAGLKAPATARPPVEDAGVAPPAQTHNHLAEAKPERGWDHVAGWYDDLIAARRSDHHDMVVHPGVIRLLDPKPGERVLDVACGQGELCSLLADAGCAPIGVDASPALIDAAKTRSPDMCAFHAGDARDLAALGLDPVDGACCVLALMNIDPVQPVLEGIAAALTPGGRAVIVVLHPAFRIPKHSAWAWSDSREGPVQSRVVDRYLTPLDSEIVMNPGEVSSGAEAVTTTTHHRPIGEYVRACVEAGLVVDAMEEWASARVSEPGPRADAENLARAEIPMFLAIRAVKPA